jgi:GT2 family glycosyltransferase
VAPTGPRVLAVLVVTDGRAWLPDVLTALEAQTYDNLDVVAVDNGSTDGSRDIVLGRLSHDRVLVAERDIGFGAAVAMALDARRDHDLVLLVHDDLALAPDAVEHLVAALTADPRLAIVGCKLVDWDDPGRLQSVGWSVDITGRADMGLEPDERDQGQRDEPRRPLVVSTAGMLFRRDVFDALGRFDRRYHVFRDDLDLCWRAWLAGWEVEVVPAATARHVRAASNYRRLGQTVFLGPRYFAERNTFATLLKNYGAARLLVVVPLFVVVGLAKVVGFVATRRVADAWQTLRAWAWNLVHLGRTLEQRRHVQRLRRRTDLELRPRFERITPRVRAYAEALADRLTGGDLTVGPGEETTTGEPQTVTARFVALVRRRPIGAAAAALAVFGLVIVLPLLPAGPIRGGDLAPFPARGGVFFEDYVASWHNAGGVGTAVAPSPAQVLLGMLQVLLLGSGYVASRLLLLAAVPVAWILSLRAIRPLAPRPVPRIAAASLYALSPTALAALRTGRIGAIVVFVTLPAVVSGLYAMLRRSAPGASAWRATAGTILAMGVAIAFEPSVAVAAAATVVGAALYVGLRPEGLAERRQAWLRLIVLVVGVLAVLFPWSLTLFAADGPVTGGTTPPGADAEPLWRWLLQAAAAAGFPGPLAGGGAVAAGVFGLLFAARRRGVAALTLWALGLGGAVLATLTSRNGADAWAWPGVPLFLTAAAFAGLFALGLRSVAQQLETHDFGWRQIGAGLMVAVASLGVIGSAVAFVDEPWSGYVVNRPALPAFIGADTADAGSYRVLTVADEAGVIAWDVTGSHGPTMVAFGTTMPPGFRRTVEGAIGDVVGGSDPGAAGRLGVLNVRYVVVPEAGRSEALERALASQLDLEPQPVAEGLVYRVDAFVPRVAWVPRTAVAALDRRGTVPATAETTTLEDLSGARYRGEVPGNGSILISEAEVGAWQAELPGDRRVNARSVDGIVRIDLPDEAAEVEVRHGRQSRRTLAVSLQLVALLLVVSLLLRPPSPSPVEARR